MLLLLSGQRIGGLIGARRADMDAATDAAGGLWTVWPAYRRANGTLAPAHVLPLGPLAWAIVMRLSELAGDSPLLLPITRLRRIGQKGGSHISYGAIRDALAGALPAGNARATTPHDFRRALATLGPEQGILTTAEAADVLGHASPGVPAVTRNHYALHDGSHGRWRPVLAWENWVIEQIRAAAPPGGLDWPTWLPPLPTRRGESPAVERAAAAFAALSAEERARLIALLTEGQPPKQGRRAGRAG